MKTVSKKLLSLLLVAILLVSAIPFQAFAEEHPTHDLATLLPLNGNVYQVNADKHWLVCPACNNVYFEAAHTFGSDGACSTCRFPCQHAHTSESGAVAATCTTDGKNADVVCSDCGAVVTTGTPIVKLGHNYEEVLGSAVEATCTTDGHLNNKKCSRCNDVIIGDTVPGGHKFSNGACTVCGTVQTVPHDPSTHQLVYKFNDNQHWRECTVSNCTAAIAHEEFEKVNHIYDSEGKCLCKYQCPHSGGFTDKPGTQKTATCMEDGKYPDKYCAHCGFVHEVGATIPRSTSLHDFDPTTGRCRTPGCSAVRDEQSYVLTLDANGGTVNGGASMTVSVTKNRPISVMPAPIRTGFNFVGWFLVENGVMNENKQIFVNQTYTLDGDATVRAKWVDKTQVLTVRRVLNGDLSTAKTIYTADVPEGTPLLDYLKANVASLVNAELALNPGFSWQNNYWRDYSGKQPLTSQADTMNQAQTVYVNFVSNEYRLYFNANGGTVSRNSQAVRFGSKVGELPTPFKDGSVFMGWEDASGKLYTANTVYNVAGDTSLTAKWEDEALVILYIYVNGDFSACNRMIALDRFVVSNNISRATVFSEVSKYYTPASGTLKIAGLFDENTWASYRLNTSKAGTENIEVSDKHLTKVFVMVSNANTGTTVLPTTPNSPTVPANGFWVRDLNGNLIWYPAGSQLPAGTGYWVLDANGNPNIWVMTSGSTIPTYIYIGSNPKTGDTAKIEIAAAIMVLAAAALVTVIALRKKKSV